MKGLALSFWISIVALDVAITEETAVWRGGEDGVIFSWGPGDGSGESSYRILILGSDNNKDCKS